MTKLINMIQITESFNYLDPGTGSYLYQKVLIAWSYGWTIYFKNLKIFATNIIYKIKNKV